MGEEITVVEPDYREGQQVDLGIGNGPLKGTYSTRIESVKENFIILKIPKVNGLYLPVETDEELLLKHYREGATFEAESTVNLRNDDRDPPTIVVSIPEEVKRIQRRDFVRVPCDIPVTVRVLQAGPGDTGETLSGSVSGAIKDISAGGVQVECPEALPLDSEVEVVFTLPHTETTMNEVFARVVRESDSEEPPHVLGLEFTSITENKRNDIIQYVYERQIDIKDK